MGTRFSATQEWGGDPAYHDMLVVVRDRIAKLVKSGKTQEQVVEARPTKEFEEKYGKILTEEEREVSYRRRVLHGKIDILRAELVNRLKVKRESGESPLTGADAQQLTDILVGKVPSPEGEEA